MLEQLMRGREVKCAEVNDRRLEYLWGKRQAEKEKQVRHSRANHIKGEGEEEI